MTRSMRALLGAAALLLAGAAAGEAQAQDYCGPSSRPDLFYNYYVAPVPCGPYGAVGAQLYVSPRPTPPLVGHTWVTYQPLLPHDFLYKHSRVYWRDHGPHGGCTKTTVTYGTRGNLFAHKADPHGHPHSPWRGGPIAISPTDEY